MPRIRLPRKKRRGTNMFLVEGEEERFNREEIKVIEGIKDKRSWKAGSCAAEAIIEHMF